MSVKISKINIYKNNWQTTVCDPRKKMLQQMSCQKATDDET